MKRVFWTRFFDSNANNNKQRGLGSEKCARNKIGNVVYICATTRRLHFIYLSLAQFVYFGELHCFQL